MYPQRASIPTQGLDRHALTVGAILGPYSQIGALLWHISPVMDLHGRQKELWKADQLTLASGGTEHV